MSNESIINSTEVKGFSPEGVKTSITDTYNQIQANYNDLQSIWKTYQHAILTSYQELNGALDSSNNSSKAPIARDLSTLENTLVTKLNKAAEEYRKEQSSINTSIHLNSARLASLHQKLLAARKSSNGEEKEKIHESILDIEDKAEKINQRNCKMESTLNSQRVWEKALTGAEAAVEGKLALYKQLEELQNRSLPKRWLKAKKKEMGKFLKHPIKQLISLIKHPFKPIKILFKDPIREVKSQLFDAMKSPFIDIDENFMALNEKIVNDKAVIRSWKEIEKENNFYDEIFKRFTPYYLNALAREGQWKPVSQISFKKARNSKLFVTVHKQDPISMVPSGIRKKPKLIKEKSANLYKVQDYVLGDDGKILGERYISYRGAQLPTQKNASYVFEKILGKDEKDASQEASASTDEKVSSILFCSFLTPNQFYFLPKKYGERDLLAKHKKNIITAHNKPPENGKSVEISISNIGVNCMASMFKVFNKTIRMGWHTNTSEYMNPAVDALNKKLETYLAELENPKNGEIPPDARERLNALLYVGKELQRRWEECDFAFGDGGFQFLPYWIVMHQLLGVTVYKNCKSGKDRTGEIESRTSALLQEVLMLMHEKNFAETLKGEDLKGQIADFREKLSLKNSEEAPTKEAQSFKFLKVKKVKKHFWSLGVSGIERKKTTRNPAFFSKIEKDGNILKNTEKMKKLAKELYENEQRIAHNLNLDCYHSNSNPEQNTGQAGKKYAEKKIGPFLETKDPTRQSNSGFDRDFVLLYALIRTQEIKATDDSAKEKALEQVSKDFLYYIGGNLIDTETQKEIAKQFKELFATHIASTNTLEFYQTNKKKLEKFITDIEYIKKLSFKGPGKAVAD